jgi:hypothetical protein
MWLGLSVTFVAMTIVFNFNQFTRHSFTEVFVIAIAIIVTAQVLFWAFLQVSESVARARPHPTVVDTVSLDVVRVSTTVSVARARTFCDSADVDGDDDDVVVRRQRVGADRLRADTLRRAALYATSTAPPTCAHCNCYTRVSLVRHYRRRIARHASPTRRKTRSARQHSMGRGWCGRKRGCARCRTLTHSCVL